MRFVLLLLSFTSMLSAAAQRSDKKLERELRPLLTGFRGSMGIYVKDLETGRTVSIDADSVFPTASMVKVPILIGVMDKIHRGELKEDTELTYRDSLLYAGVDILGSFKDSERIELGKVMMLMLTMSDNTASLWLQTLAGTGARINALLDSMGLVHTRVNSRTPGREENRKQFGWGQTTPREMATLLEKMVRGEVVSREKSECMIRLLGRNYWDEVAISQIPADVFVASKNGAVDASRSEVLFVNGRGARYILCVCTKNNADTSWKPENEAWVLTRKISKLVWETKSGKK